MKVPAPRSYQIEATNWFLSHFTSGIFARPGAGKTRAALHYANSLRLCGAVSRVLVIAPLAVCRNVWPEEITKWGFDMTWNMLHGKAKIVKDARRPKAFLTLINPQGLEWLCEEALKGRRIPWDLVIVDESSKLKAPLIIGKEGIPKNKTVYWACLLASEIPRRIIMSGNMRPNALEDLFTQLFFLDTGKRLGRDFYHFRGKYFKKGLWNWEPKPEASEKVALLIADKILTVDPCLVDVPAVTYVDVWVSLPKKARELYELAENDLFSWLDKAEEGLTIEGVNEGRSKYALCKQIAQGAYYEKLLDEKTGLTYRGRTIQVHSEKMEALDAILAELNGGQALIGLHFQFQKEALAEAGILVYEGKTEHTQKWNNRKISVMAGNPESMGHGINLQGGDCSDVIWLTLPEKPDQYPQFNGRIVRPGNKNPTVVVHRILARRTVDVLMSHRLAKKNADEQSLFQLLAEYRKELRKDRR